MLVIYMAENYSLTEFAHLIIQKFNLKKLFFVFTNKEMQFTLRFCFHLNISVKF